MIQQIKPRLVLNACFLLGFIVSQFRQEHWARIGVNFDLFRVNEKFCDIEITVDGETFKGHKMVLASCSPYFETMFLTGLYEGNQASVEIKKEMSANVFKMLFTYMYKGEIDIKEDNVTPVLAAANYLQIQEVINTCCAFLRKNLEPQNVSHLTYMQWHVIVLSFLCSLLGWTIN